MFGAVLLTAALAVCQKASAAIVPNSGSAPAHFRNIRLSSIDRLQTVDDGGAQTHFRVFDTISQLRARVQVNQAAGNPRTTGPERCISQKLTSLSRHSKSLRLKRGVY